LRTIQIDSTAFPSDKAYMSTDLHTIDQELDEVLVKLMKHEPRDPEAIRQACERMNQMREQT
jgi:hypothetical protein